MLILIQFPWDLNLSHTYSDFRANTLVYIYKRNPINGDIFLFLRGYNQPFVPSTRSWKHTAFLGRYLLQPNFATFISGFLRTGSLHSRRTLIQSVRIDGYIYVCVCARVCGRNRKRHIIPSKVSALPGTVPNSSRSPRQSGKLRHYDHHFSFYRLRRGLKPRRK